MLPDRVSNPGPLTYESGALPIAARLHCNGERLNLAYVSMQFESLRFPYRNCEPLSF